MVLKETKKTYNKSKSKEIDKSISLVCRQTGAHAYARDGSESFSFEYFFELYDKKLDKLKSKHEFEKLRL